MSKHFSDRYGCAVTVEGDCRVVADGWANGIWMYFGSGAWRLLVSSEQTSGIESTG